MQCSYKPHPQLLRIAISADPIMTSWWNSRSSVFSLLLFVAATISYTATAATTKCNLKVEECPNSLRVLHIESVVIPECCEWPCNLRRNTTASIIIEFHTGKSFQTGYHDIIWMIVPCYRYDNKAVQMVSIESMRLSGAKVVTKNHLSDHFTLDCMMKSYWG